MFVSTTSPPALALTDAGFVPTTVDGTLTVAVGPERGADIARALANAGHWVTELVPETTSLEDLFLDLTSDDGGARRLGGCGMTTFVVECRRCLSRRAVRVLIGIALLGCAITGVMGVLRGARIDLSSPEPALTRLADLWRADDPVLGLPLTLLSLGALIGAALVVGGEWKSGTVPTVLTWEPRRMRLFTARLVACASLAMIISLALLVVFVVVGVLPGVLVHGEVGSIDADWGLGLAGAVARNLALAGVAAAFGGAIASLGRSTTAAIAAVFVYEAVVEPIARSVWPKLNGWLLSENAVAWATGRPLEEATFQRDVLAGGATLAVYVAAVVALALVAFERRDVT